MRYQDIQVPDQQLYNEFVEAFKNGNYPTALSILNDNPQLATKSFTKEVLNDATEILSYLQTDMDSILNMDLEETATQLNKMIDQFEDVQEYSSTKTYQKFNFVTYNNKIYFCLLDDTKGIAPTNTSYWVLVGLQGQRGADGTGLMMKFDWRNDISYSRLDTVTYNETWWVATQTNIGQTPSSSSPYWTEFVHSMRGEIESSTTQPTKKYVGQIWLEMTPI